MSEKIYNYSLKLTLVQIVRVCIQTFTSLLLGIFIASAWLVNDVWFKKILEEKIQTAIGDMIKVPVVCKIKDINLLSSKITCSELLCVDKDWKFESSDFVFKFSWLSFFLSPKIEAELIFYDSKASTIIKEDNSLPLFDALKAIFNAPTVLPIVFNNYTIKQCQLNLINFSNTTNITLLFSIDTLIHNNGVKNIITISDGVINYKNKDIFQHITSNSIINLKEQNLLDATTFHFSFDIPLLKEYGNQFNLTGNYQDNTANISISNDTRTIVMQIDNLKKEKGHPISYTGQLSVKDLITNIIKFKKLDLQFTGNDLDMHGKVNTITSLGNFEGNWKYDKSSSDIDNKNLQNLSHTANPPEKMQQIKLALFSGNLNAEITNTNQIDLTKNLKILEQNLKANLLIDKDLNIKLYYNTQIQQQNKIYNLLGEVNKKENLIKINGLVNSSINSNELTPTLLARDDSSTDISSKNTLKKNFEYNYDCTLNFNEKDSSLGLISLKINDGINNLINLNDNATKKLKGELNDCLIKDFITNSFGYEIKGNSKILLTVPQTLLNKNLFSNILFEIKDANIRLPYIYNNINSINGEINLDIDQNRLFINNLKVKLHKGILKTNQASIAYDLNNYDIDYIHIPIIVSDCLVSWKKDFFGILTGRLLVTYNYKPLNLSNSLNSLADKQNNQYELRANSNFNNISKVEGYLILENSYLHSNFLSSQVKKENIKNRLNSLNNAKNNFQLNVELITYEPIKVKNKFLDTSASINAISKGTILKPEISGIINLQGGHLAFPHKPLYIQNGKITLNNETDPYIELVAKNTIDKHIITLHVNGTISNPEIYFESMPNLPDEQIMTLLFAGSKDGSLSSVMSAVIMTALQDLLFNSANGDSKKFGQLDILKDLLHPLKDIKITPSLSSGQGKGIKAGVGIAFKDKLKAFVQNNINMSEDTQVKVEYALSDDINICGVKDDQGNVSGEIEMRWKF